MERQASVAMGGRPWTDVERIEHRVPVLSSRSVGVWIGLGWDISGVVEQAPQPWWFRPGDEVFGMPLFPRSANAYAYAEVVLAPALHLVRKPVSLSHMEASALPIVAPTVRQGLVDLGGVREGDRVLVHGRGGGVGRITIQIAKALGAHGIATQPEPVAGPPPWRPRAR